MSSIVDKGTKNGGNGSLSYGGYGSPEMQALQLMRGGIDRIRGQAEETPAAPAPVTMPTIDSETVRRARLRAQRRMVAQGQGRESTMLGGSNTTLGGA